MDEQSISVHIIALRNVELLLQGRCQLLRCCIFASTQSSKSDLQHCYSMLCISQIKATERQLTELCNARK